MNNLQIFPSTDISHLNDLTPYPYTGGNGYGITHIDLQASSSTEPTETNDMTYV